MPLTTVGWGIIKLSVASVRPSVCRVPRPNSKTERPRNLGSQGWKPITRVTRESI